MNTKNLAMKLTEASAAISKLASENSALTKEKDELALENVTLKLRITAMERARRSLSLAQKMFQKGMIPRRSIEEKAEEIMSYNDEAFGVLEKTVLNRADQRPISTFEESLDESSSEEKYDRKEESKKMVENKINSVKI